MVTSCRPSQLTQETTVNTLLAYLVKGQSKTLYCAIKTLVETGHRTRVENYDLS